MIDLKVDSVHLSANETSVLVKFAEPVSPTNSGATGQQLRCDVKVPLANGESFLTALSRARALLADTTVVATPRKPALN